MSHVYNRQWLEYAEIRLRKVESIEVGERARCPGCMEMMIKRTKYTLFCSPRCRTRVGRTRRNYAAFDKVRREKELHYPVLNEIPDGASSEKVMITGEGLR